jgi:hypothetical protein
VRVEAHANVGALGNVAQALVDLVAQHVQDGARVADRQRVAVEEAAIGAKGRILVVDQGHAAWDEAVELVFWLGKGKRNHKSWCLFADRAD